MTNKKAKTLSASAIIFNTIIISQRRQRVNNAKELLKELQDLDMDIQSRIDEINELEAGETGYRAGY